MRNIFVSNKNVSEIQNIKSVESEILWVSKYVFVSALNFFGLEVITFLDESQHTYSLELHFEHSSR